MYRYYKRHLVVAYRTREHPLGLLVAFKFQAYVVIYKYSN